MSYKVEADGSSCKGVSFTKPGKTNGYHKNLQGRNHQRRFLSSKSIFFGLTEIKNDQIYYVGTGSQADQFITMKKIIACYVVSEVY